MRWTGTIVLLFIIFHLADLTWGVHPDYVRGDIYGNLVVGFQRPRAVALYTVIFPSILAQVFYIRGVDLIGANRAGLFINLVPVFGTLLSVLLLGEEFFAYHLLAIVLTLGGIALAEFSGRKLAH